MVTIHNLEVHLEVDGADEEAGFVRLFDKHIRRWYRLTQEEEARRKLSDRERRLHGADGGEL
jgi:hypothetical protein